MGNGVDENGNGSIEDIQKTAMKDAAHRKPKGEASKVYEASLHTAGESSRVVKMKPESNTESTTEKWQTEVIVAGQPHPFWEASKGEA